jgi:hypothetical protein
MDRIDETSEPGRGLVKSLERLAQRPGLVELGEDDVDERIAVPIGEVLQESPFGEGASIFADRR